MEHKYIDANALREKIFNLSRYQSGGRTLVGLGDVNEIITWMPAADVEPVRHGEWKKIKEEDMHDGAGTD